MCAKYGYANLSLSGLLNLYGRTNQYDQGSSCELRADLTSRPSMQYARRWSGGELRVYDGSGALTVEGKLR